MRISVATQYLSLIVILALLFASCAGGTTETATEETPPTMENKGIGPITILELSDDVDPELAARGKEVYNRLCTTCHKLEQKYIGPASKGIMDRRSPEWIMNMILNPEQMVLEDPIAKQLLIDYNGALMTNMGSTQEEARAILEYFRTL